ncbi:hypothetical protein F7234_04300 [Pseudomonas putida]|nr:hypothetical protein F7234_04300 [Pseudomonas putida]
MPNKRGDCTAYGGEDFTPWSGICVDLCQPLRGQARSYRYSACPVGAGLPAKRPTQAINFRQPVAARRRQQR